MNLNNGNEPEPKSEQEGNTASAASDSESDILDDEDAMYGRSSDSSTFSVSMSEDGSDNEGGLFDFEDEEE